MDEVVTVNAVRRSDRHRHAVQRHRMALAHLAESSARTAAGSHEVFGDDLDEIDRDGRMILEEVAIMRLSQTKAKDGNGHGRLTIEESGRARTRPDRSELFHLGQAAACGGAFFGSQFLEPDALAAVLALAVVMRGLAVGGAFA